MKPLPQIPISDLTFWNWVARNLANFNIVSVVPTVDDLKKGDTVLYESGTARRLYFNISGTIFYITVDDGDMVLSDSVITDHALVRGDGGARRVQDSGIIIDDNDNISGIGDVDFAANGGFCFGEIYVEGIDVGIALAAESTYYQVAAWSPGSPDGVNGESNNTTPDVSNDHITILTAGKYFVHWFVSCYSTQKNEYEFEIFINNGDTGFPNTGAYRTTSVASAVGLLSGGGICEFAAGDTVELWVERKDGAGVSKTITIRAATVSVMKIGGP